MKPQQPARAGGLPAHSCRHAGIVATVAISILLVAAPRAGAQNRGAPAGGGRDLVALDFSTMPLGAPPKEVRVTAGKLDIVEKDGVHMLRSSEEATFLVTIPEKIPNKFALEFDLVPKFSGETNTTELSFEGTREVSHSDESAHVHWSHNKVSVIGGGQTYDGGQIDLKEDLREEVIGNLTKVRAEFDGSNLTVTTNGRTVFESKIAKFNRGRILRVQLGGTDEDENAVYLASMRMTSLDGDSGAIAQNKSGLGDAGGRSPGSPPERGGPPISDVGTPSSGSDSSSPAASQSITGITVTVDAVGVATVTWNPLSVAATYQVLRWNTADAYCCTNMSRPGEPLQTATWVDGLLPKAGTYGYRVIAKTANGTFEGETRYNYGGSATPPPGVAIPSMPIVKVPSIAPEPLPTNKPLPGVLASPTGDTATGVPSTGTVLVPEAGEPAPYSSGPRRVSIMPTEPAPTDTVYEMPAPSDLDTLEASPGVPQLEEAVGGTGGGGTAPTEPVMAIMAEPVMQTGTMVGIATVEPAKTDSGTGGGGDASNLMQDATRTSGGGGAPASGRYRVMITGFAVAKAQNDDLLNLDGIGNEVFAAAAVVHWNRSTGQLTSFTTVQTLDYGDVGTAGRFGNRIKAGTGSMSGGIVAGNRVPAEYDPTGGGLPAPASDRFPLLIWEGTLSAGVDSVVVCPSIWEHDEVRTQFEIYKSNWSKASPSALMSSTAIANKSSSTTLETVLAPIAQSVVLAPPALTFIGSPADSYKIIGLTFAPGVDRLIGMGLPALAVLSYQDRFIVVTQENAGSLAVGGGVTLALPYPEPIDLFLSGIYTLYVRVERIQ